MWPWHRSPRRPASRPDAAAVGARPVANSSASKALAGVASPPHRTRARRTRAGTLERLRRRGRNAGARRLAVVLGQLASVSSRVERRQQAAAAHEHLHLAAQRLQHAGQFDRDIAAADDATTSARRGAQVEEIVGRPAQFGAGNMRALRPGRRWRSASARRQAHAVVALPPYARRRAGARARQSAPCRPHPAACDSCRGCRRCSAGDGR